MVNSPATLDGRTVTFMQSPLHPLISRTPPDLTEAEVAPRMLSVCFGFSPFRFRCSLSTRSVRLYSLSFFAESCLPLPLSTSSGGCPGLRITGSDPSQLELFFFLFFLFCAGGLVLAVVFVAPFHLRFQPANLFVLHGTANHSDF